MDSPNYGAIALGASSLALLLASRGRAVPMNIRMRSFTLFGSASMGVAAAYVVLSDKMTAQTVYRKAVGLFGGFHFAPCRQLLTHCEAAPPASPASSSQPQSASHVLELTAESFASAVLRSDEDVLVMFYAPWCGYCRRLFPVWEELASSLRSTGKTAVIAQIDLTAHSIPQPAGVSILGYPTIYLFRRGAKGRPVEYRGPREVRAFAEFIERHRETNA